MKALLIRDLRLAVRAGGGFGLGLVFFLIVVMLVPFAHREPTPPNLQNLAWGTLWIGALLACLLTLDRIFALDYEDGSLALLVTAPIPLEALVLSKALVHWLTTGLPLTLIAPVLGVLLYLPPEDMGILVLSLAIGTPALSMIGAFGAALTMGLRRGGLLMSLLVLPLYVPTLIFGAKVAGPAGIDWGALAMCGAVTLGVVALLPFATAAVLRINLR